MPSEALTKKQITIVDKETLLVAQTRRACWLARLAKNEQKMSSEALTKKQITIVDKETLLVAQVCQESAKDAIRNPNKERSRL
ncbi:hypothetical protein QE152_g33109 [Popillia japonica]|uniref:Uncharacterized protein n=1 Tax=Popillia japonica TaxID=7064 RepID=A0AAW1IY54_POPJA